MKRNCNLELRLVMPSVSYRPDCVKLEDSSSMLNMDTPNQNQLTIATELHQGRPIIWLPSHKFQDEQFKSNPPSPLLISSLGYSPTSALLLKRSLQRFLEKRKSRSQPTSPYTISKPT